MPSSVSKKARLYQTYQQDIKKMLAPSYANAMEVPALKKIVVHITSRDAVTDSKALESMCQDLFLITGQKPIMTRAKKSIAAFKLRAGMPIGCMVTLRKGMMYEFLDRLINIALPRVRDFKGCALGFDKNGNFSLGLKEQIVFPEIDYDKVSRIRGMNITMVTSAKTPQECRRLLEAFNLPFIH